MLVSKDILERCYASFTKFVSSKDNQPFTTFKSSKYIDREENYKYSVWDESRVYLASKYWRSEDVGSGRIQNNIVLAMPNKVQHLGIKLDNNLFNWRHRDDFKKLPLSKELERYLYNFYKNKVDVFTDQEVFEYLLSLGLMYRFVAYLFFIKDKYNYLPILQTKFDDIFKLIGLPDFKTVHNGSWENYTIFLDIISQTKEFLKTKGCMPELLDAHSFLWILGSKMQGENIFLNEPNTSVLIESEQDAHNNEVVDFEEDDEGVFPEGRDVYRWHKYKERNTALVNAAKLKRLQKDANLCCDACGDSFVEKYGDIGRGYIEAHHIFPIHFLTEETEAKVEDIALVCSNCHRMLHRRRPWLLCIEDLKLILANNKAY